MNLYFNKLDNLTIITIFYLFLSTNLLADNEKDLLKSIKLELEQNRIEKIIELAKEKAIDSISLITLVSQVSIKKYDGKTYGYDINQELIERKNSFIKLIANKEVDLSKIEYPALANVLVKNELFIGQEQWLLEHNLELFFKKFPAKNKIEVASDLGWSFGKNEGFCMGFSSLWLYSKWQQFFQPAGTHRYDNEWFDKIIGKAAAWDGEIDLSDQDKRDFLDFGSLVSFFNIYYDSNLAEEDMTQKMALSKLNPKGNPLQKRYAIAAPLSLDTLLSLLKDIIYEDELIYIYPSGHVCGLYKHNNEYYFYDPDNNNGEYKTASLEKLAQAIFSAAQDRVYSDKVVIGFAIYSFDEKSHSYPKPQEFLAKLDDIYNNEQLGQWASQAIFADCLRSFKSALDKIEIGIKDNNVKGPIKASLLLIAAASNHTDMVVELLNKKADANRLSRYYEYSSGTNYKTTPLCIAAKRGYIKIVEALINDPKTKIELEDERKKTARQYAIENGHTKIVELLDKTLKGRQDFKHKEEL